MNGLDEISLKPEQMNELSANNMINLSDVQKELAIQTICELRDLLTFMKGYKQIIDVKHPEAQTFEHWDEINADLDAMAKRLSAYEKRLHTIKEEPM